MLKWEQNGWIRIRALDYPKTLLFLGREEGCPFRNFWKFIHNFASDIAGKQKHWDKN